MPTHNTKWFSSDFGGAPACSGQAGQLLAVLNACLVDGFNLLTLDSLVVAGNVATATKNGHGFKQYQIIEIAGATPAGLNGKWRVTATAANTFTFTTSGISDQTATGTITAKTPGAGWEKPFTGTNVAVYRSLSIYKSGTHAVRVTDTGTTVATCLAAEDWADVNTPVNSFQTFYVPKSSTADGTARAWTVIVDDRTLYLAISWNGGSRDVFHWGDFTSLVAGDGAAFQVRAPSSSSVANLGHRTSLAYATTEQPGDAFGTAPRDYSQVIGAVQLKQASLAGGLYLGQADLGGNWTTGDTSTFNKAFNFSASNGYAGSAGIVYSSNFGNYQAPNPADGGLHFVPVFLFEGPSNARRMRGTARGLLHILETRPASSEVTIYSGIEGVTGGLVMVVKTQNECFAYGAGARVYPLAQIAFDLGDWA